MLVYTAGQDGGKEGEGVPKKKCMIQTSTN